MCARWRIEPGGKVLRGGIGRGDPGSEKGCEEKQDGCRKSYAGNDTLAEKLPKGGGRNHDRRTRGSMTA
jgi:hypothetical protein